jgi:hypothetical protein
MMNQPISLRIMLGSTYRFVISHREPIASEPVQHLVIQQFFFDWVVQVHVLIEEQMFFEQEYVTVFPDGFGRVRCPRVGVPVPLPLGHDVRQLFLGYQTPFGIAQHLVDRVPCRIAWYTLL